MTGGAPTKKALIGVVDDATITRLAALKIDVRGHKIGLTHGAAVKTLRDHGPPNNLHGRGEVRQDHLPITVGDLFRSHTLLADTATFVLDAKGQTGSGGAPPFVGHIQRGNRMIEHVWQVSTRNVSLVSMSATRIGKRRR